ncbi:DNA replication and repair protein RecO [Cyclobacterium lianum]|uniref:DNA repair protein RecO n=1 Tax=Cyclobacterium lianum TaxID=388280 RepID=A0A1M7Q4Z9_9BACT|nr:DNA repair protein RecO [Cyclobacterium lianum]SHN25435.1 DNA replication and repair protein RecO [Cyclobacterium lianum]
MLKKTSGIVISYTKFRETSIIARIFTRNLGLKSYLVNGVRSHKSKTKMAHFQTLTLLDLVVYEKENANINRISEVKLSRAFHRIPFDFYRSGIGMFMGEFLGKIIFDNYQNEQLFDHLFEEIVALDSEAFQPTVYLLLFLMKTSRFLGFEPADAADFYLQLPLDQSGKAYEDKRMNLDRLMVTTEALPMAMPRKMRSALIDDWLLFYKIHMENFGEIRSLAVLRAMTQ